MDAVYVDLPVLPPVISRTLSPGKRNLLLEEQLLTQPFVFVKRTVVLKGGSGVMYKSFRDPAGRPLKSLHSNG